MEKKTLKKLSLNKEEIVNLNDSQMNGLRGGATTTVTTSSKPCSAVISYVTAVIVEDAITRSLDYVYDKISEYFNGDDDYIYNGSMLPEVVVTPAPTTPPPTT